MLRRASLVFNQTKVRAKQFINVSKARLSTGETSSAEASISPYAGAVQAMHWSMVIEF